MASGQTTNGVDGNPIECVNNVPSVDSSNNAISDHQIYLQIFKLSQLKRTQNLAENVKGIRFNTV